MSLSKSQSFESFVRLGVYRVPRRHVIRDLGFGVLGVRGSWRSVDRRDDGFGVLRVFGDLGGRQTDEILACTYRGMKTIAEVR